MKSKLSYEELENRVQELEKENRQLQNYRKEHKKLYDCEILLKLFDNMYDGFIQADAEGRFIKCNSAFCKMVGYSEKELKELTVWEITPKKWHHFEKKIVYEHPLKNGYSTIYEKEYRRKDGKNIPVEIQVYYIGEEDKPTGFWGIAREISDLKKYEQELRESQLMMQSILNTIPVRVYWKDKNLNYLGCNKNFASDAGLNSIYEIIGKNDKDLTWKDMADKYREDDRLVVGQDRSLLNHEEQLVIKDNKHIWIKTNKVPLKDIHEKTIGLIGVYEDISFQHHAYNELEKHRNHLEELVTQRTKKIESLNEEILATNEELYRKNEELVSMNELLHNEINERVKIEEALRESEIKFRSFIEQSSDGMSLFKSDSTVVEWNNSMEQIFGIKKKDVLGKNFVDIEKDVLKDDRLKKDSNVRNVNSVHELAKLFLQDRTNEMEFEIPDNKGKGKIISLNTFPVETEKGNFIGSISRDNTEKRTSEKELENYRLHLENIVKERTEELLEREERIRTLNDNLPDGAILRVTVAKNGSHHINYGSANLSRILGIPRNKLVETKTDFLIENIHLDDRSHILEALNDSLKNMKIFEVELRYYKNKNNFNWLHIKCAPHKDHKGNTVFDGYIIDITRLRQAEEMQRLMQYSIDKTNNSIFWFGPDGKFVYVNEAAVKNLGYTREELLNKYVFDISPEITKQSWSSRWEVLKDKKMRVMESQQIKKDGTKIPVEIHANYLDFNGMEYVFAFSSDITERLKAENALKNSERNYREIFNATSEAIFIHDAMTGMVVDVNNTMLEMYNCTYEDALTLSPDNFSLGKPPYNQETAYEKIRDTLAKGNQEFEWLARKKTGETFWAEVNLKLTEVSGEKRILSVVRDITERKMVAEDLAYRGKFEKLISEISTRFINLAPDEVDAGIEQALGEISALAGTDSGYLCRISDKWDYFSMTHLWNKNKNLSAKEEFRNLETSRFPWWMSRIKKQQIVSVPSVKKLSEKARSECFFIERWNANSLINVPVVSQGKVTGVLGFTSITDNRNWLNDEISLLKVIGEIFTSAIQRKDTFKTLAESEKNYREIFNAPSDAILIFEIPKGKILDVNQSTLEMYGYTDKYDLGDSFEKISANINTYKYKNALEKIRKTVKEGPQVFEWLARKKNGEYFWVEVSLRQASIGGQERILAVIRDINERKKTEDALATSEHRYRTLFEQAADGIFVGNRLGNVTEANINASNILGYSNDEIIQKNFSDFFDKKELEAKPLRYDIVENGKVVVNIRTMSRKDGTKVPIEMRTQKLEDGRLQVFVRDITEKMEAEQKEIEQKEFLNTLLETIPIPVYHKDIKGFYKGCNSTFEKYSGFTREEVIGKKDADLFPEELADIYQSKDRELLKAGIPQNYEAPLMTKSNELFEFSFNKAVYTDAKGAIIGYIGALFDITERKKAEKALRESENRLKLALETTSDGLWDWNVKTGELFYSPRYLDMLGYQRDELKSKSNTWLQFVHPADEENATRIVNEYLYKKGENFEIEFRVKTKNKEWKWVLGRGKTVEWDEHEEPVRMLGTINDITERKYADQALRESEEKFRLLFETASDAIFMMKGDRFIDCNSATLKMFACTKTQIVNQPPYKFSPKYQPDGSLSKDSAKIKIEAALKKGPQFFEWQHIKYNGEPFNAEVRLNKIELGNDVYIQAIVRDITDRKKAEQALKLSEQKFRNIFENSSDGILITKLDQTIIEANYALLKEYGVSKSSLKKLKLSDLVPVSYLPDLKERLIHLKKNEPVPSIEMEITSHKGKNIPIEINSRPIDFEGEKVILSIIRDIRERKQIEKKVLDAIIRTEEQEREKFARNIHDDLGPLLSSIKMYINSIQSVSTKKKVDFIIQQINEIVKEAIVTTKEISNDLSPHILTNYGIIPAIELFTGKIVQDIDVHFETNLNNLRFSGDIETTLYRIVKELVNNTLKHAGAKNIYINISYDMEHLNLNYQDDGIGFDVENVAKSENQGRGISNIYSRSKSLNGIFRLYSCEPYGTCFDLNFPAIALNK